jgi:release factor glutamine methyltransferase
MRASKVLSDAVEILRDSPAIDHWQRGRERIEAEDLLCHALGVDDLDPRQDVPGPTRRRFDRMIARRSAGEPVQLIKGYAVFRGLEIFARPGVFVPRDSTEFLAAQAVRRLRGRRGPTAVDVATGGGTVALAIANEVRGARVFGTDISAVAVRVARANANNLRLRATFRVGDLFRALPSELERKVDVVTLHPPYVPRGEMRDLPDEVRRFEPVHTLTDRSADGLGLIGRTAEEAPTWLRPGGWLLIEVSPDRARAVAALMRRHGFEQVRSTVDRGFKVTRVVVGRWPS